MPSGSPMEAARGLCVSQTLAGYRRDARHHRESGTLEEE